MATRSFAFAITDGMMRVFAGARLMVVLEAYLRMVTSMVKSATGIGPPSGEA